MSLSGTCIKQDFSIIRGETSTPPPIYTPVERASECCFVLPALAESAFTRAENNDFHSPIFFWGAKFSSAVMKLQTYTSGAWVDVATLTDNTYGTYHAYGFFETNYNEKAIGYTIDWALVLSEEGAGNYRIKCTGTDIFSNTEDRYSFDFCLKEYTQHRADGTVRIDWWMNGNVGSKDSDLIRLDYGDTNWYNSIRLPDSFFGSDEPNVTRNFVKYQSGAMVWTSDDEFDTYTLKTGLYENDLRRFLRYNTFKGSEIKITDYNLLNPTEHINRYVVLSGAAKINYYESVKRASLEVKFDQYYQNNNKKRC